MLNHILYKMKMSICCRWTVFHCFSFKTLEWPLYNLLSEADVCCRRSVCFKASQTSVASSSFSLIISGRTADEILTVWSNNYAGQFSQTPLHVLISNLRHLPPHNDKVRQHKDMCNLTLLIHTHTYTRNSLITSSGYCHQSSGDTLTQSQR